MKYAWWLFLILGAGYPWAGIADSADQRSPAVVVEHLAIEGPFEDGIDVTDTCLECHEEAAADFMQTSHWTWSARQEVFGRGWMDTGKRHAVNNFCYGVASNLSMCTECHAGYGWKDETFDFDDPSHIDCLVCHDTTGTYHRLGGDGGVADPATDFENVARKVGMPGRANCGVCHFYSGSGHAVKHGDLEGSLLDASTEIDVHMAKDGGNFACQRCHVTEQHLISGTAMSASPAGEARVSCASCHETPLHEQALLDRHSRSVACQTCHIPLFARGEATKTSWDWSAAGKQKESEFGADGLPVYVPYKGRFEWGRDIVPEYAWFNGLAGVHAWGDKIGPSDEILLNWPVGSKVDPDARIFPFKVHRGRQIYDSVHRYLINPLLVGDKGFAHNRDWDLAARIGMQARGLDYSGAYDFVNTLMYLKINHMVAPASDALGCRDCHGRDRQRMDWERLGYKGDPLYVQGQSRYPVEQ